MDGSNNWVVSGRLSPTGVPILSNDPHRTIEMPSLRYFVHLVVAGMERHRRRRAALRRRRRRQQRPHGLGLHVRRHRHGRHLRRGDQPGRPEPDDATTDAWEPMRIIREEIRVKGEATPRIVELKFTRHGPVFYEDTANHRAYVAKSVNQEPGTAPVQGEPQARAGDELRGLLRSRDVLEGADAQPDLRRHAGNIALQVSGLTPDRNGWNGRLPVPGTGKYEWKGFRSDLPREYNPERGYIATANDNTHPPGYKGRPVLYRTSVGVEVSRIARIRQMLGTGAEVRRRRPQAHAARRLLAARRARPAALPGLDEQGCRTSRRRARHDRRLGQGRCRRTRRRAPSTSAGRRPKPRVSGQTGESRRGQARRRWSRRDCGRRSIA